MSEVPLYGASTGLGSGAKRLFGGAATLITINGLDTFLDSVDHSVDYKSFVRP
jgi:hypothetical protein